MSAATARRCDRYDRVLGLLRGFADLVAPRRCAGCDLLLRAGTSEEGFGEEGFGEEGFGEEGFCEACSVLLDHAPAAMRPPAVSAAVYAYGGPVADAIRRLKYGKRTDLVPALAAPLALAAAGYAGRVDEVIPVPLHAARLRHRGFNQAALLSAPVARALGVPLRCRRLIRARRTLPQANLPVDARADNVRGAFAVRPRARSGGRVLLVDDVKTTGATIAAASAALRAAGAEEIYTLVLAWVADC